MSHNYVRHNVWLATATEVMRWMSVRGQAGNMRGACGGHASLYRLYLGIADGMSIAQVWACRYSK